MFFLFLPCKTPNIDLRYIAKYTAQQAVIWQNPRKWLLSVLVSLGSVPVVPYVLHVVIVVEGFEEKQTLTNGSIKPIL